MSLKMNSSIQSDDSTHGLPRSATPEGGGDRLLRRTFVSALILISGGLITSGVIELYFRYQESLESIGSSQRQMAEGAAFKIEQFVKEIERTMRASTKTREIVTKGLTNTYRFELIKLLKIAPAITEASAIDSNGREQAVVSRLRVILSEDLKDRSSDEVFLMARKGQTFFSPIYFVRKSEPYMIIAVPIERFVGESLGVLIAEVSLKYIWDVVSRIKVGQAGYAYVVSGQGDLIAHPDNSLVLQKRNLALLQQVKAALNGAPYSFVSQPNLSGQNVFSAYAPISYLGWAVLVERPVSEVYAPLYASVLRTSMLLLVGLGMALLASFIIGRRVVRPVEKMREGAARIGAGALDHRIEVRTGDELEALAESFNRMAADLQKLYADLEGKVTENTKLYQDLQRSHQELLSAQAELVHKTRMAAVGETAAAVAHETRNPLGALTNCVQVLRKNPDLTGEDAELLTIIQNESQRLNRIVSDFLAFGRPRPPHFQEVNLQELIDETLAPIQREGQCPSSIVFSRQFEPSLPTVWADRDQLRQVFWNLFLNAIQAMGKEGKLHVGTRIHNGSAEVVVQDTGPGIAKSMLPHLFEPFHSTKASGTGLGLAIVRRIVEEHGGRITVDNTPDAGTCFVIALPLGRKDNDQPHTCS
jgi:two-component system, NtrC family, sensor kinase